MSYVVFNPDNPAMAKRIVPEFFDTVSEIRVKFLIPDDLPIVPEGMYLWHCKLGGIKPCSINFPARESDKSFREG